MNKQFRFITIVSFFTSLLILASCNSEQKKAEDDVYQSMEIELDSLSTKLVKFNNTLFSLPSPYQLALMVKENGLDYNNEILNKPANLTNYTTSYKKALNLGIYGTDLAYLNIYDQIPDAISYFSVIKVLADDLGVSEAFDPKTVKSLENNMGNKDSLLFIISNTYRSADAYLKANNRNDVGVLVLAGGWIEGLHILIEIAKEQNNQEILNRIGENKQPLENLIKILSPYYNQNKNYEMLIEDLMNLAGVFDGIIAEYTYVESEIYPEKKLTVINSEAKTVINEEQFIEISNLVNEIRNKIIN